MTYPTMYDREHSNGYTEWIKEFPGHFLSHDKDGDKLYKSNRPYAANDLIHQFPPGHPPTLADIDAALTPHT